MAAVSHAELKGLSPQLQHFFSKRINLLIVDDQADYLSMIADLFWSPVFNVKTASSLPAADETIRKLKGAQQQWSCWILDVSLGNGQSGLALLDKYPMFPFVIVLSGIQSMETAADAMERGALKVFDKSTQFHKLHDAVCKAAALGFLMKGARSEYMHVFRLLHRSFIRTPAQWAELSCFSLRQLQNVTMAHTRLPPRFVIPLYHTLYYILRNNNHVCSDPRCCPNGMQIRKEEEWYLDCMDFVDKNFNEVYKKEF